MSNAGARPGGLCAACKAFLLAFNRAIFLHARGTSPSGKSWRPSADFRLSSRQTALFCPCQALWGLQYEESSGIKKSPKATRHHSSCQQAAPAVRIALHVQTDKVPSMYTLPLFKHTALLHSCCMNSAATPVQLHKLHFCIHHMLYIRELSFSKIGYTVTTR
jgi:hypothetical protein